MGEILFLRTWCAARFRRTGENNVFLPTKAEQPFLNRVILTPKQSGADLKWLAFIMDVL
jgi:hypothetical protein